MRVVILAEGSTERTALEPFLRRAIQGRSRHEVGISVIDGGGASKLRKDLIRQASSYLDSTQRNDVAGVIALFDLVSPPEIFAASGKSDAERMDATAAQIERQIGDDRFHVAFACPEVEAWLFADIDIFPAKVRSLLPDKIAKAPETTAGKPSEQLSVYYRRGLGKAYRKTRDGRNLFARLDPSRVAERCPRFRKLLDAIVELADE